MSVADVAPASGVDWIDLAEALRRFAAATGLCVCAYDDTAQRRIGPIFSSRVAGLMNRSGAWEDGGRATAIERGLAGDAASDGRSSTHRIEDVLQVMARPILFAGRRMGTIVFGWVFSSFSTSHGCLRIAKALDLDAARLWAEVRLESPIAPERLQVSAELLDTLTESMARHALALERLHELARMREGFLAFVSHELRTPLAALSVRIDLLLRGPLDKPEAIRDELTKMRRHVRDEVRLVEDLIEAARTQTGHLRISKEPCLLHDILGRALDSVRPGADAKSIRLNAPEVEALQRLAVLGDAGRLQQVFWNLLANAVKFTPAHGVVTVTVHAETDMIHVAVADTGSGIDAAVLTRVFEPFTKQERGNAQGLGLGLAIAKGIIEQHAGSITVRSDGPGTGATFHVVLPRHRDLRRVEA